jgi:transcriptional regulator with XRE-family HTH domain
MAIRLRSSSRERATEERIDEELSYLVTHVTNEISWHMREHELTRADLASRMGVSPGRVSQILSGSENLTLRTIASLTTALDARLDMALQPLEPGAADDAADGTDDFVDADDLVSETSRPPERSRRLWEASRVRARR